MAKIPPPPLRSNHIPSIFSDTKNNTKMINYDYNCHKEPKDDEKKMRKYQIIRKPGIFHVFSFRV